MPAPPGNIHYLARNHDSWTPAAVIFLDSETMTTGDGPAESEVLRCWTGQLVRRRHRRKAGETEQAEGTDRASAAAAIDTWASSDKSTWLYAHNVAFDLVTTGLAAELARLGWELSSRHAVSGASPWLIMHKGRQTEMTGARGAGAQGRVARVKWQHTLTIADSFSLMPVRLEDIAAYSPHVKPPLPAQHAGMADWLARCRADTDILAWAVLTLMDWWDAQQIGKWSISGAACGWNSYRHKIGPKDVLIDPAPEIVAFEHQAVYGGRRDVFRCGKLPAGRYAEIDFTAAYPTIAATQSLPAKRIGPLTDTIARAILAGHCNYGMVAECVIDTDEARWPLRWQGRVFYATGRFRTVLAGPDIIEAHRLGALESVGKGYFYAMSSHMRPWARWVLSLQATAEHDLPGPVRIWAKGASRSVCGKWAQRGWSTEPFPGPPGEDWSYEDVFIAGSDARASICGLAGKHYLSVADQESEHEFPAILAYIESHCRTRLNRVIATAPENSILQCDTDGIMASMPAIEDGPLAEPIDRIGSLTRQETIDAQLRAWNQVAEPLTMRIKHEFERAVVHGPQHVVIDGRPRFAGVPSSAWQTGDNSWAARLWPGLSWQIQHGGQAGYKRPVQPYLVVGPYAPGWILADRSVVPVEAAIMPDGSTGLLPWELSREAAQGAVLAPDQGGWAAALLPASHQHTGGDNHVPEVTQVDTG